MAIDSRHRRKRDRHERGLHGPLLPHAAPFYETPNQFFVRQMDLAISEYEEHLGKQIGMISFGIESVPSERDFVLSGNSAPLGRIERGNPNSIVIYQRAVEMRARDKGQLIRVMRDVLAELIARLLGVDPTDVDPHYIGPQIRD